MQKLKGIPASPGIALGPAYLFKDRQLDVSERVVQDAQAELTRLETALKSAKGQIEAIQVEAQQTVSEEEAAIFEAHGLFLEDPELLKSVRSAIENKRINCEFAWNVAIESYARKLEALAAIDLSAAKEPAVTKDGCQVEVVANIGRPEETAPSLEFGAEGIGLLRTEFLYLDKDTAPDEEQQTSAYREILSVMGDRPVVVRTLDVGGDKPLPYLDFGEESNPFLGWRAIRMCLVEEDFFKIQLRALLRASFGHDLRIMFPMIATLAELEKAKSLLQEAQEEVHCAGEKVASEFQVGVWVGLCGELAGDPQAIPILLGLGLDEFSMAPALIPRAKSMIRTLKKTMCESLAKSVLN